MQEMYVAKIRLFLGDCLLCFHGGFSVMHKTFLTLKYLKSALNWKKTNLWELHVMTLFFLIAVKYLGFVCFKMAFIFLHVSVVTVTVALIMLHLIKRGTMSLLRYLWPYKVLQNSFLNSNPMFKSPDNVELSFARITKILTWVYWIVEIMLVLINNSFIYCGFFKKKKKKALFWHIFSASLQKA